MKKIFFVFCCVILFSCKKHPFDYRAKYIGNYNFTFHYVRGLPPPYHVDTTYYDTGKINYGSDINKISIYFSGGNKNEFVLYEDGTLAESDYYYDASGEFASSNDIIYSFSGGGLGCACTITVTGQKK